MRLPRVQNVTGSHPSIVTEGRPLLPSTPTERFQQFSHFHHANTSLTPLNKPRLFLTSTFPISHFLAPIFVSTNLAAYKGKEIKVILFVRRWTRVFHTRSPWLYIPKHRSWLPFFTVFYRSSRQRYEGNTLFKSRNIRYLQHATGTITCFCLIIINYAEKF
jgi:hypothetical protein